MVPSPWSKQIGNAINAERDKKGNGAMIFFGVDPGKSGSISAIWDDGKPFVSMARFDGTDHDVAEWVNQFDLFNARAVLEKVASRPGQGVSSTFKFGRSYGFCHGLLCALEIPYMEVTPAKWQAAMGCRTGGDKNVSKAEAQRLWPSLKITHRNADSLLLAEYARSHAWKL